MVEADKTISDSNGFVYKDFYINIMFNLTNKREFWTWNKDEIDKEAQVKKKYYLTTCSLIIHFCSLPFTVLGTVHPLLTSKHVVK